jgi:hypothetical protein
MQIGGRKNKIINALVNKYISYLMVTITKKEFSGQIIPNNEHGKKNNKEKPTLSLERR